MIAERIAEIGGGRHGVAEHEAGAPVGRNNANIDYGRIGD